MTNAVALIGRQTRLIDKHLDFIKSLTSKFGPEQEDYDELSDWFRQVHALVSNGTFPSSDLLALRLAFGTAMSAATLQGFVCARPHGYAGDFEIIDRIYTQHISADSRFARWDHYFHAQAASKAVRNRKDYFHQLLRRKMQSSGGRFHVLVVGSGPGRDVFEYLSEHQRDDIDFECIDIDAAAIAHARTLNQRFLDRVTFRRENALRLRAERTYDLIWAAGIFDYLNDRIFQMVVRRLVPALAAGGEMVIGNFSLENESRPYMEFGDWYLHHRSADALMSLAISCGVPGDSIRIGSEPEGVNLFLHIAP